MKCDGCKTDLSKWNTALLQLLGDRTVLKCPICNFIMEVVFNRRARKWESIVEYEERQRRWRKGE